MWQVVVSLVGDILTGVGDDSRIRQAGVQTVLIGNRQFLIQVMNARSQSDITLRIQSSRHLI